MKKAQYFSKDFEWDELRVEVENDPSFSYHILPFQPSLSVSERPHSSAETRPWNDFHHRHASGKFFKERRYLLEEFPELLRCGKNSKVLEVGCGNGSTVLPILRGNENVTVYACDCSTEALERVKETIYSSDIVLSIVSILFVVISPLLAFRNGWSAILVKPILHKLKSNPFLMVKELMIHIH